MVTQIGSSLTSSRKFFLLTQRVTGIVKNSTTVALRLTLFIVLFLYMSLFLAILCLYTRDFHIICVFNVNINLVLLCIYVGLPSITMYTNTRYVLCIHAHIRLILMCDYADASFKYSAFMYMLVSCCCVFLCICKFHVFMFMYILVSHSCMLLYILVLVNVCLYAC
jgi:hypothetical protein